MPVFAEFIVFLKCGEWGNVQFLKIIIGELF